jgi:hypothetical protein
VAVPLSREREARRLALRRRSLELGHLQAGLSSGRRRLHPENWEPLGRLTAWGLKGLGLWRRGLANALDLRLTRLRFRLPRLPSAFDGLRVLFLSDLHLDGLAGLTGRLLELVEGLHPDLCLLGGDYRFRVRGASQAAHLRLARLLAALRPPLGVAAVLGNHDFAETGGALESWGAAVLRNQSLALERGGARLWLAGVDDPHYYAADDLPAALAGIPAGQCRLLLAHSPELAAQAAAAGVDLYLCGHTHAGQVRLPGLGPLVANAACPRRLLAGAWRWGAMPGYTTSGVGCTLLPVRFGCRGEAALITLEAGEA